MKLRIRFGKHGVVKFIGHLDMMRYFQKAFRRAGFDMAYSKGFHPHQLITFASPLGVGLESSGEYMDIEVVSAGDLDEMKAALAAQMAEGVEILSIHALDENAGNAMSLVAGADYKIAFREDMMPMPVSDLKAAMADFMARPEIQVLKKTKKSERIVDIRPLIYDLSVTDQGEILMQVSAGSAANLKPELVLETFCRLNDLPADPYAWLISRLDMYTDLGKDGERRLVSLEKC